MRKTPMGTYFQVEWVPIPMLPCPFCGKKAKLRRHFAIKSKWYDTVLNQERLPKKKERTLNLIEVGCFDRRCLINPLVKRECIGDPDGYQCGKIVIELKNIWNKRTKRKMI